LISTELFPFCEGLDPLREGFDGIDFLAELFAAFCAFRRRLFGKGRSKRSTFTFERPVDCPGPAFCP
jgi:hypothetical protein